MPLTQSPLPRRFRPRFTERGFRRFAVLTTVVGLGLMAWGLTFIVLEGRFVLFLVLFGLGGLVASASVFAEIREPTPEELAAAAEAERARARRARRWAPAPEAPRFTVTLYTREGCTVCKEARALLDGWRDTYGFDVWEEDVDADPALKEKWSDWVPVGMVGDEELFRLSLDAATVEPKLAALAEQP